MDITKKNFEEQFENINRDIKRSCLIAFDAEFTAILSGDCFKYRLFDTSEERYNRIKNEVSKMVMTQIGLTLFQYDRDQEEYVATSYTFHLCPQVFGNIDQSFIFQASTLKFLCQHNFNFNKFIYEGLPYLSKAEEAQIHQQIKDQTLLNNMLRGLDIEEERVVQKHCSEVSKWICNGEEETMYIDVQSPAVRYIIHNEIRSRFPGVLTTNSLGNSNKILIYRNKNVEGANNAPMKILEENLLSYSLGFSRVINVLASHQKPIVGHNLFLDLVLLQNQFIGPLPKKYSDFKKSINNVFPTIFDTKYISHEMYTKLPYDNVWTTNALQDLYEFFSKGKCKKLENGVNAIKLSTPFGVKQSYHEAGWDSYCSGHCFIRMGHWAACELRGKFKPVGPKEKIAALATYCNRINIIRGAIPYMNIVGDDPPRHRPDLLHVRSVKERNINIAKVASTLGSFGTVDVKAHGRRTALVAANSRFTRDNILKQFRNNKEYKISKYSVYRHSIASRMSIWGGAIITGSLLLLFLHRNVNKI